VASGAQTAKRSRRRGGIAAVALAISLAIGAIGGCFGRVWYQQQALRMGQSTRALEAENLQLARRCSILQAKVARLHAPACLETYAGYRMEQPKGGQLLRISAAELRNPLRRSAALAAEERPPAL
jgi:uncharacterized protein HemX